MYVKAQFNENGEILGTCHSHVESDLEGHPGEFIPNNLVESFSNMPELCESVVKGSDGKVKKVARRPSPFHNFNGSDWVLNRDAVQAHREKRMDDLVFQVSYKHQKARDTIYAVKVAEAKENKRDGLLAAEAQTGGADLDELMSVVLAKNSAYEAALSAFEIKRIELKAVRSIENDDEYLAAADAKIAEAEALLV